MRHPFCRYRYVLEDGKPFDRYGLEQQAEIVKDAFLKRSDHGLPFRSGTIGADRSYAYYGEA
jgi:hypothetical protein